MNTLMLLTLPVALLFAAPADGDQPGSRGKRHGKIMQLDKDGDGAISKSEAEGTRLADAFAAIDANSDAKITKDELKAAHAGKYGHGKHKSPEERFAKIDGNGDGKITKAELEAHHAARAAKHAKKGEGKGKAKGHGKHDPAKTFARFDADNDGAITLDEMKAARAAHEAKKGEHKGGKGKKPKSKSKSKSK